VNIPEYAEQTVAEGAFLLMLSLARKLPVLHARMNAEGWAWPSPGVMGYDLAGKTIGLVGRGRIGVSMARMCKGFDMRVLAYDPYVSKEAMAAQGITKVDKLHDMLRAADFVSIHTVLNSETKHLVGAAELLAMKQTAVLINVSRGGLVDEAALVAALEKKTIAGCGLDVYSEEPLTLTGHLQSPLFAMDNVMLLPHLTFYTHEVPPSL
jgi:D-3-phosphoglycerate dehydrogenase